MKNDTYYLTITPEEKIKFKIFENCPDFIKNLSTEFSESTSQGILALTQISNEDLEDPCILFWKEFGNRYLFQLCSLEDHEIKAVNVSADEEYFLEKIQNLPPISGAEYLTAGSLNKIWMSFDKNLNAILKKENINLREYIERFLPNLKLIGKVYFHLAENKASIETPFAFLATYSTKLNVSGKAKHLPLAKAVDEYSKKKIKNNLHNILKPIQNLAKECSFIKKLLESGDIFHPQLWSSNDALIFLKNIPKYEYYGVLVRIPNWWNPKSPLKPEVKISVGDNKPKHVGLNSLLDFNVTLVLGDDKLTDSELQDILNSSSHLIRLRGNWVEVDKDKLKEVLNHWKSVQKEVGKDGISFLQAMRLLAGTNLKDDSKNDLSLNENLGEWSTVTAGDWFYELLHNLRNPENNKIKIPDITKTLKANLRPYQKKGLEWLWLLYTVKLGGCLADDMGLGKTIQIISLLLCIKNQRSQNIKPSLLIVPTSLLANWNAEILKFAPSLKFKIAHAAFMKNDEMTDFINTVYNEVDLLIITYGGIIKFSDILNVEWETVILDEAQAIKNANTKQALVSKKIKTSCRFALSGTPVENKLSDLWSIFDFICPGLLGNARTFLAYSKTLAEAAKNNQQNIYKPLRELVKPYILRRLKTDKNVISDLPNKTEMKTYCLLSKKQIVLYQKLVSEMESILKNSEGIKRQGLIFSYLNQFKQICNHPEQWGGTENYHESDSGKFIRLREILEDIKEKQEKVLIFTQFKEMTEIISKFAQTVFASDGFVIHGATNAKKRQEFVELFNTTEGSAFFILSLKAAGTGLNLVGANHVIHFDRWWNPAVENQATDRAFRIGQKKNVMVHKFICQGTIEEKIDSMIDDKRSLSQEILEGEALTPITELSNEELIKLISLDINKVNIE